MLLAWWIIPAIVSIAMVIFLPLLLDKIFDTDYATLENVNDPDYIGTLSAAFMPVLNITIPVILIVYFSIRLYNDYNLRKSKWHPLNVLINGLKYLGYKE